VVPATCKDRQTWPRQRHDLHQIPEPARRRNPAPGLDHAVAWRRVPDVVIEQMRTNRYFAGALGWPQRSAPPDQYTALYRQISRTVMHTLDSLESIDVEHLVRESQARNDEDDPRDLLAELEHVGYVVRDSDGNPTLNRAEPPEDE
jgi:hypothetical protein